MVDDPLDRNREIGSDLLAGRVALVSGAGPGLGRATALALARHGADLVLAARRAEMLEALAAEIEALGRRCLWQVADVTAIEQCRALVDAAARRFGRLDVVVNNAFRGGSGVMFADRYGIAAEGSPSGSDPRESDDVWRLSMDTNLFGSLNMTRAALDALASSGDGRIVMIGTMAIREVRAGQSAYAISKAALLQATRSLAVELGPSGIRVNMVLPGYIRGAAVERWMDQQAELRGVPVGEIERDLLATTAIGAIPTEDEVAGAVVWLASPLARPVTGQAIDVNAGQWL